MASTHVATIARGRTAPTVPIPQGCAPARFRSPTPNPTFADEAPIDLVALQADDELINALAAGLTVAAAGGGHQDDQMTAILAAWKAEVDAEPMPALVDLDTAVTTVQAARRPSGRSRHLVPVAAAAAGLVILLGGVSLGSYSAEPDDTLWPVTKVLYSERAESVEAAGRVEERIARAKRAIAEGQPALAEEELRAAAADLAVVRPEDGLDRAGRGAELPAGEGGGDAAGRADRRCPADRRQPAGRGSLRRRRARPRRRGPTSPDSGSPAPRGLPSPAVDPRILGDVPPAPAERPEVSTVPDGRRSAARAGPGRAGRDPAGSTPVEPAPPVEQAPGDRTGRPGSGAGGRAEHRRHRG